MITGAFFFHSHSVLPFPLSFIIPAKLVLSEAFHPELVEGSEVEEARTHSSFLSFPVLFMLPFLLQTQKTGPKPSFLPIIYC